MRDVKCGYEANLKPSPFQFPTYEYRLQSANRKDILWYFYCQNTYQS